MFELDLPWWELVLRASLIYIALLVMMRFTGKRTVGQFTPFDLLVVMLLSEGVSNSLRGGDESVWGGLLVAATLIIINLVVGFVTSRSSRAQALVEGAPVLIGKDGKIFEQVLKKHHLPPSDVEQALREADCNKADMKYAFLEVDGKISILKDSTPL